MGLLDLFRRAPAIADRDALMQFIDSQAAFLGQKGVYEYSRARAGPYGNMLFSDKGFLAAVEVARWIAYPLALMMVGEAIEGELRLPAGPRAPDLRRGFAETVLAVFDRYPAPAGVDALAWQDARTDIERTFGPGALHPIRRVIDIPERYVERYVAAMPIHEKLKGKDAGTIHNYLKANLCNVHELFLKRANVPRLVAELVAPR
jgi:hypothetical protein